MGEVGEFGREEAGREAWGAERAKRPHRERAEDQRGGASVRRGCGEVTSAASLAGRLHRESSTTPEAAGVEVALQESYAWWNTLRETSRPANATTSLAGAVLGSAHAIRRVCLLSHMTSQPFAEILVEAVVMGRQSKLPRLSFAPLPGNSCLCLPPSTTSLLFLPHASRSLPIYVIMAGVQWMRVLTRGYR